MIHDTPSGHLTLGLRHINVDATSSSLMRPCTCVNAMCPCARWAGIFIAPQNTCNGFIQCTFGVSLNVCIVYGSVYFMPHFGSGKVIVICYCFAVHGKDVVENLIQYLNLQSYHLKLKNLVFASYSLAVLCPSRKHTYIILAPINPTFI